ncbi:MAG: PA2778 family cysteine peptidase [Pseudobdellovibrio sp.]
MKCLVLGFALFLASCASTTKQTDYLFSTKTELIDSVYNKAPFINQEAGHCGPATLTMAIQSTGQVANLQQITEQVYSPNAKGSLQSDMISSARRQGMLAIPLNGLMSLLKEIEAGNSVIVFENLGIKWIPTYHYALATGYDLSKKILIMHSGPTPNEKIDIGKFELYWKQTEYWGLVVLKPDQLSATGEEVAHLHAAAALEQIGKLEEAKTSFITILKKWPRSLIAHIGLGNVFFNLKEYAKSVIYLEMAVKLYPESKEALHNLHIAQNAANSKSKNY